MGWADQIARADIDCVFHDIAKLTHIARIGIVGQLRQGLRRKTFDAFAKIGGKQFGKVIEKQEGVVATLPERWHVGSQHV